MTRMVKNTSFGSDWLVSLANLISRKGLEVKVMSFNATHNLGHTNFMVEGSNGGCCCVRLSFEIDEIWTPADRTKVTMIVNRYPNGMVVDGAEFGQPETFALSEAMSRIEDALEFISADESNEVES